MQLIFLGDSEGQSLYEQSAFFAGTERSCSREIANTSRQELSCVLRNILAVQGLLRSWGGLSFMQKVSICLSFFFYVFRE
jgi:hypothetical protein